ncbi:MAG TPA: hypothetical protein VGM44_09750 [Polyangiaceae bacterium]
MNSVLLFIGFLAAMLLVGWVVKKITGAKAYFVETFPLEMGERVLWEDALADAYPIPSRQALYVSYRRLTRSMVKVTNCRIIVGAKALFRAEHMVLHVLYPADRQYPEQAKSLGGGLLSVGYQALVFDPASIVKQMSEKPPYIELALDQDVPSSVNLRAYRIYTDAIDTFGLQFVPSGVSPPSPLK